MENESGVNEVRVSGIIEVTNEEKGLNANGMMQKRRRGTASHKTELSEERTDLVNGEIRS